MGLHDELQDLDHSSDALICSRCERMCEPLEIQVCPGCRKPFCNFCVFRMGGAEYCSRQCGEALFFGNVDSEEGIPEDEE